MAQLEPYRGGYYLWKYVPSAAPAVIFLLLFLTATIAHSWRMFKTRTWFCICLTLGGLFEFIGYAARASAHDKTGKMMPYVIQSVYILVAPALFAASIYMTLGRLITSVNGQHLSIIRPSWLTKTFVIGDIFSFCVQGGAAGLMATGSHAILGENIVVAGLFIQILMFGLFVATGVLFQVRIQRSPTTESYNVNKPWKSTLYMLYGISALIMIRSISRATEYIMGQDGYLLTHQWTLYIFDSLPMFVVMVLFYVWYPSQIQPGSSGDIEHVQLSARYPKA